MASDSDSHPVVDLVLYSGEPDRPLALNTDLPVAQRSTIGPGRILANVYLAVGKRLEQTANNTAHKWGFGPIAVSARIEEALIKTGDVQSTLDQLYSSREKGKSSRFAKLENDCRELVGYAHR